MEKQILAKKRSHVLRCNVPAEDLDCPVFLTLSRNCNNVHGQRLDETTVSRKRKCTDRWTAINKSSRKLQCTSSSNFLSETGQRLVQSIWTDEESLLLAVVLQTVQRMDHHLSVMKVFEIFNLYGASFDDVRQKTQTQVAFKMRLFKKYANLCK